MRKNELFLPLFSNLFIHTYFGVVANRGIKRLLPEKTSVCRQPLSSIFMGQKEATWTSENILWAMETAGAKALRWA